MADRNSFRSYLSSFISIRSSGRRRLHRREHLRRLMFEPMEERRLMTVIDLASLSAAQGTIVFGADAGDGCGFSVHGAGDVNGDGFDDVVIGAFRANASGNAKSTAGESYVIFGAASLPATIDLANLGSAGMTIFGADAGDSSGISVSNAGDVNGDGFDDLVIGAYRADASANTKNLAGDSYVIFGAASLPASIDLANLGSAGVTISGADAGDTNGRSVSGAGDVNGDGFDDLVIGAYRADASGNAKSYAGDSYVIFGAASLPASIDLANLGSAGITIFGADVGDYSGLSVSGAGDVNGDGFDDFVVGAMFAEASGNAKNFGGDSYVIFGAISLPPAIDLANLGSAGFAIFGAAVNDYSGTSVSSAGDVNGDGFDDLIIGARGGDASADAKLSAGDSYVVFGAASFPAAMDFSTLGSAGITIFGADAGDRSGTSVSSAGDVNGDGFDDLIVGASRADASGNAKDDAGDSYVIFGAASLPATIDLSTLSSATGITILGVGSGDYSGHSVSSAGDVNGDGFDDIVIGAHSADASGNAKSNAGESYVIFGGNSFTNSVTHLGTEVGETLTGTSLVNRMVGGRGNDTISGEGGADILIGGQGNDVLRVNDLNFRRIDGGTGNDSLVLNVSGLTLDLTVRRDNRILSVETIDITGFGDNTLVLGRTDVLNISSQTNTLFVRGNTGDTVVIDNGWTQAADQVFNAENYQIFVNGAAVLRVLSGVAVRNRFINLGSPGGRTTVFGADVDDRSGRSVSSAGDVNGDGFDDFLVGAFFADASGNTKLLAGESYVVFGAASLPATIDLANLGSAGITIFGAGAGDRSGCSVSSAGDVNGDGFDDLLVGAYRADDSDNSEFNTGDSYVIFGAASPPSTIDLANLGSAGITIFGVDAFDYSARSVSSAGDVNGDGFDDFVIGAYKARASGNAKVDAGDSYLIFGAASLPATIDLANLGSAGITIFGAGANVAFNGTTIGTFTGGTGTTPLVFTFNNQASFSRVQLVLNTIGFASSIATPTTTARTISVRVTDGIGGTSALQSKLVNINQIPVIGSIGPATNYNPSGPRVLVFPTATITDPNTVNFANAVLTVTNTNGQLNDLLAIVPNATITVSGANVAFNGTNIGTFTGGSGTFPLVFTFNNQASFTRVQLVLNAIGFSSSLAAPSTTARTVTVRVTDGIGGTSALQSKLVNINQIPVIGSIGPATTYNPSGPRVLVFPTATITDPNTVNFANAVLTVTNTNGQATDSLAIIPTASITVSGTNVLFNGTIIGTFTGGNGTTPLAFTFNNQASVTRVQLVLNAVGFASSLATPTTTARTITVRTTDGLGGTSVLQSKVVNINLPPVIGSIGPAATYNRTTGARVLVFPTATITDATNGNFANAVLTLTNTNGQAGDSLAIIATPSITVAGSNVLFNGTIIGTFSGGTATTPLVFTFNNQASFSRVQLVLNAVGFASSLATPSTTPRTISVRVTDGLGGTSALQSKLVNIL